MPTNPGKTPDIGHHYFDPKKPDLPEEVLGIPAQPLIDLTDAMSSINYLASVARIERPYSVSHAIFLAGRDTEKAIRIFPLIERIQAGEDIKPQDVRPYRKPIKRMVPKISTADRWAAASSIFIVGIPIRRYLNRKVETEFPKRIPAMLDKAVEFTPLAEPYVEFLEQFENPREQFVSEVEVVAKNIRHTARHRAKSHPRKPAVTAEDAAYAIRQQIELILSDSTIDQKLPMMSHLLLEKMPKKTPKFNMDVLGVGAPEIIAALDNALPEEKRDYDFLNSVVNHPHPKRWLAEKFKSSELYSLKSIGRRLLPSIRDILPIEGKEVRNTYRRVQDFLAGKHKK